MPVTVFGACLSKACVIVELSCYGNKDFFFRLWGLTRYQSDLPTEDTTRQFGPNDAVAQQEIRCRH